MEDIKSLVTIFLQKIFQNRQHVIDTTYKLIYDYNNGDRKKVDYEKTLKSICNQLGKEIPDQVLVYLLTLVDMPLDLAESDDSQLKPVIEKIKTLEEIQKTQNCLTDSMKPHLEEYVGNKHEERNSRDETTKGGTIKARHHFEEKRPKGKRKASDKSENLQHNKIRSVQSLLDLTAVSVIRNSNKLKKTYQKKFEKAWKLIKSNQYNGTYLHQCYETLRDLNKKRKLLRDIENNNITEAVMAEMHQDVDIFLKEKHVYNVVNMDLLEYITGLINKNYLLRFKKNI
ncbi:hypothetical protein ABEB36_008751 [Hypothenemus hampei]|uniref:Uncharacterized protein n=1 Tax=Hypothenemus hampei TaxID=57062 RepID=A0ABD1EMY9_HYPHA